MNKKYLITGATGFVGANLVRKLIADKKEVHVIVRNKKLNWRLFDICESINIHECDLLSPTLSKVVSQIKPDFVFHLAAYGSLPHEGDMNKLIDINLRGTINLITAVKKNKFKLFINTGSSSEYGIKDRSMSEMDLPEPINDYGIVKLAVTAYVYKEAIRNDLPMITFRPFAVYGPYEEKTRLIPSVVYSAVNGEVINVGNSSNVRDFIYIDDVVDAYLGACNVKIEPGEIYNIGTGIQYNIKDVVEMVLKISESSSKVNWGVIKKQNRQIEPKNWRADTIKSSKVLRWKTKNSLEAGLRKTIDWFKENKCLYE